MPPNCHRLVINFRWLLDGIKLLFQCGFGLVSGKEKENFQNDAISFVLKLRALVYPPKKKTNQFWPIKKSLGLI
jgi:hypothetical protein